MLELNGTVFILFFSFVLFAFLMKKIIYEPLESVRTGRDGYIEATLSVAENNTIQAEKMLTDYDIELNDTKFKASTELQKELIQAQKEADLKIREGYQKSQNLMVKETELIQIEAEKAKEDLQGDINRLAKEISMKVLKC